jgi:acyl dehydratase
MNDRAQQDVWLEGLVLDRSIDCGTFRLTEREIMEFAAEYDPQPFHLSLEAANESAFGGLVASSVQTIALSVARMVRALAGVKIIGGIALEDVRLIRPVWPDRDYRVRARWISARPSASKPDRGIAQIAVEVLDEEGAAASYRVTYLVRRRPSEG